MPYTSARRWATALALAFVAIAASAVICTAQQPAAARRPPAGGTFKRLAPGIETTVPVHLDAEETAETHNLVDITRGIPDLEWTPNFMPKSRTLLEMAKSTTIHRTIWNLEFTFKPLRMVRVDVPQRDGTMDRKVIWYMVYRVKNKGGHLKPRLRDKDEQLEAAEGQAPVTLPKGTYAVDKVDEVLLPFASKPSTGLKFFPMFLLETQDEAKVKSFNDHIMPVAVPAIQRREDANRTLLNTVEMTKATIQLSTEQIDKSVWGVVTWEDVDPKTDYFSIYISGLTNAYRWKDNPEAVKPGTPPGAGRTFTRRMLKLNLWRPGDEYLQHEEEIRQGMPTAVDYEWVWR
ncbi:MAG: hypothetical protein WD176_05090 [Pirellulales bacterium]